MNIVLGNLTAFMNFCSLGEKPNAHIEKKHKETASANIPICIQNLCESLVRNCQV